MIETSDNRLTVVRRLAQKLHDRYGLRVPVDLSTIVQQKGIKLSYRSFKNGGDGYSLLTDPPEIVLNEEITFLPRRRFTLAHELGHHCISWHTGIGTCATDDPFFRYNGQNRINSQELEANTFASELLMPTRWVRELLDSLPAHTPLPQQIEALQVQADTSIMACLYALEGALPSGNILYVRSDTMEYYKTFVAVDTYTTRIYLNPLTAPISVFDLMDKLAVRCFKYRLSMYEILHYELMPCPEPGVIERIYRECGSDLEALLNALTDGQPIKAVHCLQTILDGIGDSYFTVVSLGNQIVRRVMSRGTALRLQSFYEGDFERMVTQAQALYKESGLLDLDEDARLLWIRETVYEEEFPWAENPDELVKEIVHDLYAPEQALAVLRRLSGIAGAINGTNPGASRERLYHLIKQRLATDPELSAFMAHESAEKYISSKVTRLLHNQLQRRP